MSLANPITLLHLSDTQFGRNHRFAGTDLFSADTAFDTLLTRAKDDLLELKVKNGLHPDVFILSGDVAEWGYESEFDDALRFVEGVSEALALSKDRVVLVPGNHDINRKACEGYFNNCEADEKPVNRPFWPKWRHYVAFLKKFYRKSEIGFNEDNPWMFFEISDLRVVIAGLNSTIQESHRDKDHYGFLGEAQLRWFASHLRRYKEEEWLRIGVLHHNVRRGPIADDENLRDLDRLKEILEPYLNCIFHGHTHDGKLDWLEQDIPIFATGSAAVTDEARPPEVPNQYQVIQIWPDRFCRWARAYAPNRKRWIGDNRASKEGDDWKEERAMTFRCVAATFPEYAKAKGEKRTQDDVSKRQPLRRYSEDLAERIGYLEPLVAPKSDQAFHLQDLYVQLDTDWLEPAERGSLHTSDQRRQKASKQKRTTQSDRRPLSDLLSRDSHRHFLLLGEPGCGKSTFCRFSALTELQRPYGVLPLLLEMKDFELWLKMNPGDDGRQLLRWAGERLQEYGLKMETLQRRLGKNRVLWLLDGLDKISDQEAMHTAASIIGKWIRSEMGEADRLIVTTRPHVLQQREILSALKMRNTLARVLPLDREAQQALLQRWFSVLSVSDLVDGNIAFWRALDPQMRTNPLLLSTAAELYNVEQRLPERRAALYGRSIDVLLQLRFGAVTGKNDEHVKRQLALLTHVARNLAECGMARDISEGDLRHVLQLRLFGDVNLSPDQELELERTKSRLATESGLLVQEGHPPRFRFVYSPFQEYLAARAFGNKSKPIDGLKPHLGKRRWREVILLTAGFLFESGSSFRGEEYIRDLMPPAQGLPSNTCYRAALALEAVGEAPKDAVPETTKNELANAALIHLQSSDQPTQMEDRISLGFALGWIGDPRLRMKQAERWVQFDVPSKEVGVERLSSSEVVTNNRRTKLLAAKMWLGRYPVTNAEYRDFIEAERHARYQNRGQLHQEAGDAVKLPEYSTEERFNVPNQPVVGISWHEARAFCQWLTETWNASPPEWCKPGMVVCLPTEEEWAWAARGPEGRTYPWGEEEPTNDLANFNGTVGQPTPVGLYTRGSTPDGCSDMAGNIWEWCWDPYEKDTSRGVRAGAKAKMHVIRGGSWADPARNLLASKRGKLRPEAREYDVGFRCVIRVLTADAV
jgi:formylglycine-generating enzyme required for sulfatase activity/3',5'-cyclic AMP phosphodiesterase CpdA